MLAPLENLPAPLVSALAKFNEQLHEDCVVTHELRQQADDLADACHWSAASYNALGRTSLIPSASAEIQLLSELASLLRRMTMNRPDVTPPRIRLVRRYLRLVLRRSGADVPVMVGVC